MAKFLTPIPKKITEAYALQHAHSPDRHYGSNINFAQTFQVLAGASVFGDRDEFRSFIENELDRDDIAPLSPSDRKYIPERFACFHLYDGAENPFHYRQWSDRVSVPWHEKRIRNLLSGRASFLCEEGDYFYEGLRCGFGSDWAEATTARSFVLCRIHEFIAEKTRDGLMLPWDRFDPIMSFRLLAEQHDQIGIDRSLHLVPVSSSRPSKKRLNEQKRITLHSEETSFARGSKFQLQIRNATPEEHHLVIEFSEDTYSVNNGEPIFRAEIMPFNEHVENRVVYQAENGEAFTIEQPAGRYGFVVFSGYDVPDLMAEARLSLKVEHLTNAYLRDLASAYRAMTHANGADLSLKLIDYSVSS